MAHFFKHFALKTYRCPKQFLCYYDFICRRACKKRSKFNVFGWFPGHQNLHVFFLKIYCRESFEIIFRQKYFPKVSFLDFVLVIHLVLKNQESWELHSDGFWVNRNSNMQKLSANIFLLPFWAAIMDLLTALRYQILCFSNIIPGGVSTGKILTF